MADLMAFAPYLVGCALSLVTALVAAVLGMLRRFPPMQKGTLAFFHPFADGGGGGERVLWCAVQALQEARPDVQIVIYARAGVSEQQLVQDAQQRFNIPIKAGIKVVPLVHTDLILPERYPRLTLVGQAVGAARLGAEALRGLVPEVFVDTTGWAFAYPLARLLGCRVAAYTHYPTVSTDMIGRVWRREATYNNDASVAGSPLKSAAKLLYYNAFALWYGACGGCAHVVMVNSSWTRRHVASLFWRNPVKRLLARRGAGGGPLRVYPPCDTEELQRLPLDRPLKQLFLVSVAQFRPEKNHRLQLDAFAAAKARAGNSGQAGAHCLRAARLKMVGSCRNDADAARLADLQQYAQQLGIADSVDWCVNVPFDELRSLLGGAVGGLHTMRDEHFGISVVEYMAAGAIPIAHDSAGPREDIVVPWVGDDGSTQPTGFLAASADEFADAITQVLIMDQRDRLKIAAAAQKHASSFSTQRFEQDFMAAIGPMLPRKR